MFHFKNLLFKILVQPSLNPFLRAIYRRLAPSATHIRFPYVGILEWPFQAGRCLKMFSDGSDSIVNSLYWNNTFEASELSCWLNYLHPKAVVLDIGANTGFYTLVSAHIATEGRVFAFEPVPRVLHYLKKNIELNQLEDRIRICEDVMSNENGSTEFYIVDSLTLPVGSSQNKDFRSLQYPTKKLNLKTTTIDQYLQAFELSRLDLVKIDTESTEHLVCQGMQETLKKFRPVIMCEILRDPVGQEIQKILDPLEYDYFAITDKGLEAKNQILQLSQSHNYLFCPQEHTKSG